MENNKTITAGETMTFVNNDFAILVTNNIIKGMTVEEAIAQAHIDEDQRLAAKSSGLYAAKKTGDAEAVAAWKEVNAEIFEVRTAMVSRYGKEGLSAYICAKKDNRLNALLTGESGAPKYGNGYNLRSDD